MVSTMQCRLLVGLVAWALQQLLVTANFLGAPGASNATEGGNGTQAVARPDDEETTTITTTTSLLFPVKPGNELVGSVDQDDTKLTMQVILEGWESAMDKFKKANAELMKLSCAELDERRQDMDDTYEKIKEKALILTYNSAKDNAIKSKAIEHQKASINAAVQSIGEAQAAQTKAAKKLQDDYSHATTLHMNVLEQYALKCGVKDKWCEIGDTKLNEKFDKIQQEVKSVDALFTEAGWLRNQAVQEFSTEADKRSAELRWGESMQHVGHVWADTSSLGFGLEVQTAACGLRPPAGPWAKPRPKCNLKPSDPMMQALLRDDPKQFVRVWKEMIGKKAGLSPDKVTVDVSGCF